MHRLDYLLYTYSIISWCEIAKWAIFLHNNELSRYLFSLGIFGRAEGLLAFILSVLCFQLNDVSDLPVQLTLLHVLTAGLILIH